MSEIYMDPEGFQSQVDGYSSASGKVGSISYSCDPGSLSLDSIERFKESVDLFNETLKSFASVSALDKSAMEAIKMAFLKVDERLADYTFMDLLGIGAKATYDDAVKKGKETYESLRQQADGVVQDGRDALDTLKQGTDWYLDSLKRGGN